MCVCRTHVCLYKRERERARATHERQRESDRESARERERERRDTERGGGKEREGEGGREGGRGRERGRKILMGSLKSNRKQRPTSVKRDLLVEPQIKTKTGGQIFLPPKKAPPKSSAI